tara:strand:- start:7714 stop:8379 length:666 start_codon:yes stop_codon:yes gene_type:complete
MQRQSCSVVERRKYVEQLRGQLVETEKARDKIVKEREKLLSGDPPGGEKMSTFARSMRLVGQREELNQRIININRQIEEEGGAESSLQLIKRTRREALWGSQYWYFEVDTFPPPTKEELQLRVEQREALQLQRQQRDAREGVGRESDYTNSGRESEYRVELLSVVEQREARAIESVHDISSRDTLESQTPGEASTSESFIYPEGIDAINEQRLSVNRFFGV